MGVRVHVVCLLNSFALLLHLNLFFIVPFFNLPFKSFLHCSFFQSSLQFLLQMHWVSTRLPMPYSPSLFFSSHSLGTVLVEHEAPYASIPFFLSTLQILL